MDNLTLIAVLSVTVGSVAAILGFVASRTLAHKPGVSISNVGRSDSEIVAGIPTATGRRLVREWLSAYKLERGCVDCGYKEYACALQSDHEGVKSVSIADARSSIDRLKKEIEDGQCVVRCANCHSIRTWRDKQKDLPEEERPNDETG